MLVMYVYYYLINIAVLHEIMCVAGKGITSYALSPGHIFNDNNKQILPPITTSDIGFEILRLLFKPISRNATEGAQTSICCAVDSRLQNESGKFYE
jgi:hypothetical protein